MELNDKMDLASYLLKPVQRMGKYALLLQQLVKACSTVEVQDYKRHEHFTEHIFSNLYTLGTSFTRNCCRRGGTTKG